MQKALDNILRHYLKQETSDGKYGRPTVLNGPGFNIHDLPTVDQEDEELLRSLYHCLEEKGVLKEVHAFLRQRLVSVLQGTWPQLFEHSRTDKDLNPLAISLIEDFLCSHKLLFTFSVLATELGDDFEQKTDFGKLASARAEAVLEELEIPKDSVRSRQILDRYTKNGNTSLLESIISISGGLCDPEESGCNISKDHKYQYKNDLSLNEKLKNIDDKYAGGRNRPGKNNVHFAAIESMDARFRALAMSLERDKQIQLQLAIEKFKEDECERLKDQFETQMKFELIKREKELLSNYEDKLNHMKNNLDREKELWHIEKQQKERELLERRDELAQAIQSIREEQRKDGLERQNASNQLNERSDTSKSIPNTGESSMEQDAQSIDAYSADREAKRYFLLQEAKLRNTVDKLSRENQELKSTKATVEKEIQSPRPVTPSRRKSRAVPEPKPSTPRTARHHSSIKDTDTIAFLQYQLEKQAEEIEELRKEKHVKSVRNETEREPFVTRLASKSTFQGIPRALQSTDLEGFLFEAKKRMADIERDAQRIGTTLSKFNEKRMGGKPSSVQALLQQVSAKETSSAHPPEILFQFPEDNLKKPVQPKIPKSVFAPIPFDLKEFPSYLKPGVRNMKQDFSIPFEPSKISFATSYSDEYRTGTVGVIQAAARLDPNSKENIPSKSLTSGAENGKLTDPPLNSKSKIETDIQSQNSETLSTSNKLKGNSSSVSQDATLSSKSESQRKSSRSESKPKSSKSESKGKPSTSKGSSSSSRKLSMDRASKSGALIKEKVPPFYEASQNTAGDENGSDQSKSFNSNNSAARKIKAALAAAVTQKPSTNTQATNDVQSMLLKRLGIDYTPADPEDTSSHNTDADEMNVYEEGRIESSGVQLYDGDDFFS